MIHNHKSSSYCLFLKVLMHPYQKGWLPLTSIFKAFHPKPPIYARGLVW